MEAKVCTACHKRKPLSEYHAENRRGRMGHRSACKACTREHNRERYRASAGHMAAEARRKYREDPEHRATLLLRDRGYKLKYKYGISTEDFDRLMETQGGVCAICKQPEKIRANLSVDHDHACCPGDRCCGKCVRGLLCFNCNSSLGKLEPFMDQVITYLG